MAERGGQFLGGLGRGPFGASMRVIIILVAVVLAMQPFSAGGATSRDGGPAMRAGADCARTFDSSDPSAPRQSRHPSCAICGAAGCDGGRAPVEWALAVAPGARGVTIARLVVARSHARRTNAVAHSWRSRAPPVSFS